MNNRAFGLVMYLLCALVGYLLITLVYQDGVLGRGFNAYAMAGGITCLVICWKLLRGEQKRRVLVLVNTVSIWVIQLGMNEGLDLGPFQLIAGWIGLGMFLIGIVAMWPCLDRSANVQSLFRLYRGSQPLDD